MDHDASRGVCIGSETPDNEEGSTVIAPLSEGEERESPEEVLSGAEGDSLTVTPPRTRRAIQLNRFSLCADVDITISNPVVEIFSTDQRELCQRDATVTTGFSSYGFSKEICTRLFPAHIIAVPAISRSENTTRSSKSTVDLKVAAP